jgi:hypothetical protein
MSKNTLQNLENNLKEQTKRKKTGLLSKLSQEQAKNLLQENSSENANSHLAWFSEKHGKFKHV